MVATIWRCEQEVGSSSWDVCNCMHLVRAANVYINNTMALYVSCDSSFDWICNLKWMDWGLGFFAGLILCITAESSALTPKQMCLVHRWCILSGSRCICYLEPYIVFQEVIVVQKIFYCLQITHRPCQREHCSVTIYLTDNMPAFLVKPYFITQDLWLILSHHHPKLLLQTEVPKKDELIFGCF